jgi:thymidylate kinase
MSATSRARSAAPEGLLVAVEGLDAAGTTAGAELIARWLERRGRAVHVVPSEGSLLVRRAAAGPRTRHALTPRVAALLAAADGLRRADAEVRPALLAGVMVVADRYAWTAAAREVARGVDAAWAAGLYAACPRPDVVIRVRHDPEDALESALRGRPASVADGAVAVAFGAFLERVEHALDWLTTQAIRADARPWPATLRVVHSSEGPEAILAAARDVVRSRLPRVA